MIASHDYCHAHKRKWCKPSYIALMRDLETRGFFTQPGRLGNWLTWALWNTSGHNSKCYPLKFHKNNLMPLTYSNCFSHIFKAWNLNTLTILSVNLSSLISVTMLDAWSTQTSTLFTVLWIHLCPKCVCVYFNQQHADRNLSIPEQVRGYSCQDHLKKTRCGLWSDSLSEVQQEITHNCNPKEKLKYAFMQGPISISPQLGVKSHCCGMWLCIIHKI